MEVLCWFLIILLFALGLIGTVLPIVPGTTIILAGAIIHRIILGERSVSWRAIAILVALTFATYGLDFLSGYLGAKHFGATKWGGLGAIVGAVVGMFFGLPGLFAGPVIGAIVGEFIAGKRMLEAGRAGWGSFLGNLGGTIGKLLIGIIMIVIFFVSVPFPISWR
jgi:uncharacterized protein YqgC (DUF456 family)